MSDIKAGSQHEGKRGLVHWLNDKFLSILSSLWNAIAAIIIALITFALILSLAARYLPISDFFILERMYIDEVPAYAPLVEAALFAILFMVISFVVFNGNSVKSMKEENKKVVKHFDEQVEDLTSKIGSLLPLEDLNQVYPRLKEYLEWMNERNGVHEHQEKLISILALSGRTNAENFIPWAAEGLLDGWTIDIVVPSSDALDYDYIPDEWKTDRETALNYFRESDLTKISKSKSPPKLRIYETDHVPFVHGFRVGRGNPAYWVSFVRWRVGENRFRERPQDPYEEVEPFGERKSGDIKRDLFESWWRKVKSDKRLEL